MPSKKFTLVKPKVGKACNSCGYCCTVEPCAIAQDYLNCHTGPCVALESKDGGSVCGMVRNPIGYLFLKEHPNSDKSVLEDAPQIEDAYQLSVEIATALGLGAGCDADDDAESALWPVMQP